MDIFERIRRRYHALGFGADADVLDMLDQSGPEPACWAIHSLDARVRSRPAGEVAALDLFGRFPAQYELVSVQVAMPRWRSQMSLTCAAVSGAGRSRGSITR